MPKKMTAQQISLMGQEAYKKKCEQEARDKAEREAEQYRKGKK